MLDLTLKINVDAPEAKAELRAVDAEVNRITASAKTMGSTLSASAQAAQRVGATIVQAFSPAGRAFKEAALGSEQLNETLKKFSGIDIAAKAATYTNAVMALGGAEKLTAAEQKHLNDVLTEALAKYAALGQKAPADIRLLQEETQRLIKPTQEATQHTGFLAKASNVLETSLGRLAAAFGISMLIDRAARALFSFIGTAITAAGATIDLSNKTGLSTDTIQRFAYVADQTGTSVDVFTRSAYKLGTQIAGSSGSVQWAVQRLGLSFQDLKAMRPDDQFDVIARALGRMENAQDRNRIGMLLFGRQSQDIMSAITEGYSHLADGAHTATADQLHALDEADDAWRRFVANRKADLTSFLGWAVLQGHAIAGLAVMYGKAITGQDFTIPADDTSLAPTKAPKEWVRRDYVDELRAAHKELNDTSPRLKTQIAAAKELGASEQELLEQFPLTEGALRLFTDETKENAKATREAAREHKRWLESMKELESSMDALSASTIAQIESLLAKGKAEVDIARFLHVTKDQVRQVADAEKERIAVEKDNAIERHRLHDQEVKDADAEMQKFFANLDAFEKAQDRAALVGRTGMDLQLAQIEQARTAELKAIQDVRLKDGTLLKERTDLTNTFYDHQRDLALKTDDTIVERMAAAGVQQMAVTDKLEANFKRDYENMVRIGGYSAQQISDAWDKAYKKEIAHAERHGALFSDIASRITAIGSAIGGGIGSAITGIGSIVNAWGNAEKAALAYRKAVETHNTGAQVSSVFYGTAVATELFMFGKGLVDMWADRHKAFLQAKADLISAHGGIHALRLEAQLAGLDLDRMWSGQSQAGLSRLERALAAQKALMERYNLTWKDFPIGVRQANVDNSARTLITDYRTLIQQGVGDDRAITGMSAALNQLVIDAVSTGTKIPVALQPILEKLIRMGGLTDDAARAMLGLGDDTMPTLEDITAAAGRYGLKLDELGPKVKQLSINAQAKQIVTDFDMLMRAGVPLEALMKDIPGGFREQVQGLVTDALTLGLTLPANLKPVLDTLLRAGGLTDQFGHKLTDLDGIKFEEPITQAIDRLIAKLQEWINKMSAVGTAADIMGNHVRGAHEQIGTAMPRPEDVAPAPEPVYGLPGYPTAPQPGTAVPRPPDPFPDGYDPNNPGAYVQPEPDFSALYLHAGGMVPWRIAHTGGLGPDEFPIIGKSGEYMHQKSAVDRYGLDFMRSINSGTYRPQGNGGTQISVSVKGDVNERNAKTLAKEIAREIRNGGTLQTTWRQSLRLQ